MKQKRSIDYREELLERLQDKELAALYINEALNDADVRVFLLALKDVIDAQDMSRSKLAKKSKISRMSTYRMLSEDGNPKLRNLQALLHAVDLELAVQPYKHK